MQLEVGYKSARSDEPVPRDEERLDARPVDTLNIKPYADPPPARDVRWKEIPPSVHGNDRGVLPWSRLAVDGKAIVTVVIVDKPGEPSSAHRETEVAIVLRGYLRKREANCANAITDLTRRHVLPR